MFFFVAPMQQSTPLAMQFPLTCPAFNNIHSAKMLSALGTEHVVVVLHLCDNIRETLAPVNGS
jgi:hypothetical protein